MKQESLEKCSTDSSHHLPFSQAKTSGIFLFCNMRIIASHFFIAFTSVQAPQKKFQLELIWITTL